MRKITAGLFATLDGVVERPDDWLGRYWSDAMSTGIAAGIAEADAILVGKDTYLSFAEMWKPQGDGNPMAAFLNGAHKYVVSATLDEPEWGPATVLPGGDGLTERIRELTRRPGGTIQVPGSPRLVRWLLAQGLLDELSLNVVPLVRGRGLRLFDDIGTEVPLQLVRSEPLDTGVVGVTYRRAG